MKLDALAVWMFLALLLAGCQHGEVGAAGTDCLRVERIERSAVEPWQVCASAERPVLVGERAGQQEALDGWLSGLILFGIYQEPTVDQALGRFCTYDPEPYDEDQERCGAEETITLVGRISFVDDEYLAYKVRMDSDEHIENCGVWSFSRGRGLTLDDIFRFEGMPGVTEPFSLDERGMEFVHRGFTISRNFSDPDIAVCIGWKDLKPYMRADFKLPQGSNTKGK